MHDCHGHSWRQSRVARASDALRLQSDGAWEMNESSDIGWLTVHPLICWRYDHCRIDGALQWGAA
jgi:hypothetical protein